MPSYAESSDCNLDRANGRGRSGAQTAGGDSKAFPRLKQPLFAVPALRELESACWLVFCEMPAQYPRSAFRVLRGSAQAVLGMDTMERQRPLGLAEGLLSGPEILRNKVHTGWVWQIWLWLNLRNILIQKIHHKSTLQISGPNGLLILLCLRSHQLTRCSRATPSCCA